MNISGFYISSSFVLQVKSLAAELCLDRAAVLDLLRDTPLNLVMMSAALPDEPAPTLVMLETLPIEIVPEETGNVNVTGLR